MHKRLMDEWMAQNKGRMVQCLRQPGGLLITRESCQARRQRARQEDLGDVLKGDVLDYLYRKGLALCLQCEETESDRFSA